MKIFFGWILAIIGGGGIVIDIFITVGIGAGGDVLAGFMLIEFVLAVIGIALIVSGKKNESQSDKPKPRPLL